MYAYTNVDDSRLGAMLRQSKFKDLKGDNMEELGLREVRKKRRNSQEYFIAECKVLDDGWLLVLGVAYGPSSWSFRPDNSIIIST